MDLRTILEKTREKSERIVILRKPPNIATKDRPYLQRESEKEDVNKQEKNKSKTRDKVETN